MLQSGGAGGGGGGGCQQHCVGKEVRFVLQNALNPS